MYRKGEVVKDVWIIMFLCQGTIFVHSAYTSYTVAKEECRNLNLSLTGESSLEPEYYTLDWCHLDERIM